VHLRDPGQQYKETIASGSRSAAVGGFTGVLAMPNTDPVIDNASLVAYVYEQAQATALTRIYCSGALSAGQKGESLAEMAGMQQAGAIAFTDDGKGVQDSGLMRLALEYASSIGAPVLSHCQVNDLVGSGQINEGVMSTRLGLAGWPAAGEELQIARDIALAELTGAALHIQHVSTARGAELVREAKERGISVTAEVTPHHLFLNETALDERYDTNLKMNPPLRTRADSDALIAALLDGTIDCVATDHAPHAAHEKQLEFELASFGVTGLETALALMLDKLVATGVMSLATLVERMAHAPRRILGLPQVNLSSGSQADLTIVDLDKQWVVEADGFESRSDNSAFLGWHLIGKASDVLVGGRFTLKEGKPV
jgi:dihydroorotase